jgi:preprotein translocase subunit SecD
MQQYPVWKTFTLVIVTLIGILYALPNLYGMAPAVQIGSVNGDALPASIGDTVSRALQTANLTPTSAELDGKTKQWVVRFADTDIQLKAKDVLSDSLGSNYAVVQNLVPRTPKWLAELGGKPMALGLDLRGGVYFLLQVDVDDAKNSALQRYLTDIPALLRKQDIRYSGRRVTGDVLVLEFADTDKLQKARDRIAKDYPELSLATPANTSTPTLEARLSEVELKRLADSAVDQNLVTLRNRVNALGVAEPLVQKSGSSRIVVQLPGIQDPERARQILSATATLEYRAVDEQSDAVAAAASGVIPPDDELVFERGTRRPYLLKREVIAAGSELLKADPTVDQESGRPAVAVTLNGAAGDRMFKYTSTNVGKLMAVLFKETRFTDNRNAEGEVMRERKEVKEVINAATINGVFGPRFQTTGLSQTEAKNLSLLLKSGALAVPVEFVEERTVGASLGADNIRRGVYAAVAGFVFVVVFMAIYYSVFGLFADVALLLNVILLVAAMSLMQATLTMPGIAGIVLTLGMAVDANVLINERIREELREGLAPHAAMVAGYERAFLTIADSNVTTLIAALVLFTLGAGPVKGFAITLALGLATSMFTSIIGTRTIAYYVFRGRKLKDLPV